MITKELLDYIRQQLLQGSGKQEIKNGLVANGWQDFDVEEAFNALTPSAPQAGRFDAPIAPLQSDPYQPSYTKRPRGLNKIVIVGVFAVCLGSLMIGGGVFAYKYFFPTPKEALQKMAQNMTQVKTFAYSGNATVSADISTLSSSASSYLPAMENFLKKTATIAFDFNGSADINDINNIKNDTTFNLNIDALTQGPFVFGAEVRSLNNQNVYLKIGSIPNLFFINLSSFTNQWIKVDTSSQEAAAATAGKDQKPITSDQLFSFLNITKELSGEQINGVSTRHYSYSINKDALKKVSQERINGVSFKQSDADSLNQFLDQVDTISGDIWVGKYDYFLYKSIINIAIKESSSTVKNFSFTITMKDYNKPVQIDVPENAKTMDEILAMWSPLASSRDTRRISDIKSVQIALELYYSMHNKYPAAAANATCENFSANLSGLLNQRFNDPSPDANYQYAVDKTANPQSYVIKAMLEDAANSVLTSVTAKHGAILGCDCTGNAYCLQP